MLSILLVASLSFSPADATNVFSCVSDFVAANSPRVAGSPQGAAAAEWIRRRLVANGADAQVDEFEDMTPEGPKMFRNVISECCGDPSAPWTVLVSHYDGKSGIESEFANDGASTTALLIWLRSRLSARDCADGNVMFVWTDGEECAGGSYAANDGLHGSRRAARKLRESGREVVAVICLDMLGDDSLDITIPVNGDPKLKTLVMKAATAAGLSDIVSLGNRRVIDDHVPFLQAGYPSLDLIDFHYGSAPCQNDYWHTPEDRLDHISPTSILKSGRLIVSLLGFLL